MNQQSTIRRRLASSNYGSGLTFNKYSETVTAAAGYIYFQIYWNDKSISAKDVTITSSGNINSLTITLSDSSDSSYQNYIYVGYGANEDESNTKTGYVDVSYKGRNQIFSLTQSRDEFDYYGVDGNNLVFSSGTVNVTYTAGSDARLNITQSSYTGTSSASLGYFQSYYGIYPKPSFSLSANINEICVSGKIKNTYNLTSDNTYFNMEGSPISIYRDEIVMQDNRQLFLNSIGLRYKYSHKNKSSQNFYPDLYVSLYYVITVTGQNEPNLNKTTYSGYNFIDRYTINTNYSSNWQGDYEVSYNEIRVLSMYNNSSHSLALNRSLSVSNPITASVTFGSTDWSGQVTLPS